MFIVHKSVTSWRIFICDAELSTFTIEQECCLALIKFWPNTLYRFFRFWIGVSAVSLRGSVKSGSNQPWKTERDKLQHSASCAITQPIHKMYNHTTNSKSVRSHILQLVNRLTLAWPSEGRRGLLNPFFNIPHQTGNHLWIRTCHGKCLVPLGGSEI